MPLTSADTRELFRVVETIHRPSTFLLDTFFPEIVEFDTETIDFDVINKGRKLAPFVHPDLPGRQVKTGGYQTKSFKPAYLKPLETVSPGKAKRRRAGEAYMGEMSAAERLEAMTLDTLDEQRTAIIRRKEWMAAMALDTGQVIVEGEDYPRTIVDFGRHADLQLALEGAQRWGESGVSVLKNIQTWSGRVQARSGITPTEVIMDPLATDIFTDDDRINRVLDNRRQVDGQMQLGPVAPITGGQYLGSLGIFNFWTYQDFFEPDEGETLGQFMPDYTVWLTSRAIEGVQVQGAIEDADIGLLPLEYAPKVWNERNPSKRHAMTQSAPLVVPTRVNHSFRARVR